MSPRRGRPPRERRDAVRAHADWLLLVEPSGPFLSVPVLAATFPHGTERLPDGLRAETIVRWDGDDDEPGAIAETDRTGWVRWLLEDLLDFGDRVAEGTKFRADGPEPGTCVEATFAVLDDPDNSEGCARLLVVVLPAGTGPDGRPGDGWPATWTQRLALLCRRTGCRLGLVTDGDQLRFVWAPPVSSTGYATWRSSLFTAERAHLESLWTVWHSRRFFAVAADQTPESLFERSEAAEEEVTDTLGTQVRHAVELLVASLDRANRDSSGAALTNVGPTEVYEAAVTVLMRLVFLLAAEERGLLPVNNPLYSHEYAISTLRASLEEEERRGRERLEGRPAAWHRILATTRAVFGGVNHEDLAIKPYGGRLFDPDRFPFLEGRSHDGPLWWNDPGSPPAVDDLTVLEVMRSLQILRLSAQDTRHLSFRSIEVEQVGHVYERLLDHNAVAGTTTVLGLVGKPGDEAEVPLADVERAAMAGPERLAAMLSDATGMSAGKVAKALAEEPDPQRHLALRAACGGDQSLTQRVAPYLGILRSDLRGYPMVYPAGTIYVTKTGSRRDSGTAYTTRALAEEVAEHTLAPLCYRPGPADTPDETEWRILSSEEILALKVCDPAVGSGAILVAACRYLADRLVDAWVAEGQLNAEDLAAAGDDPRRLDHSVQARRLVAERCCYGVDRNPMAIEMARMSFWLTTMALDRPFSFLDHNLRPGDSLLGITDLDQLRTLHLDAAAGRSRSIGLPGIDPATTWGALGPLIDQAGVLRSRIEQAPSDDARDIASKFTLIQDAGRLTNSATAIADLLVAAALRTANSTNPSDALDTRLRALAQPISRLLAAIGTPDEHDREIETWTVVQRLLDANKPADAPSRRPLHWPLAFPEVFAEGRRFDAMVGNPPFLGGKRISGPMGTDYREYLVQWIADGAKGNADLVAYFFLRAASIAECFGFLATNTISQGDTREVGLDQLLAQGWVITRAVKSAPWPGASTLEIAKVWGTTTTWASAPVLDGQPVGTITPSLDQARRVTGNPYRLGEPKVCFQGSVVVGKGFVLEPDLARQLLAKNPDNADVLFPYVDGDDINTSPVQEASRWVINFFDWPEDRARQYPECFAIIDEGVRPIRAKVNRQAHRDRWWQYGDKRPALYRAVAPMDRVLAMTLHTKFAIPVFVRTGQVFSHALGIFSYDDDGHLGVLTSGFHWWWCITYGSTLGLTIRYTPTDCFETFPQPVITERVTRAGGALSRHRSGLMIANDEGLTSTYNRIHQESDQTTGIVELRRLHVELDQAVAAAYGWDDLRLDHGFFPTPQGMRFTFGPHVQTEILDRLLELNHTRFVAEAGPSRDRPRRRAANEAQSQFNLDRGSD